MNKSNKTRQLKTNESQQWTIEA